MKQYNCKNCGAPIKHTYNHRCEYCNSIIDFNEPKEDVVEFKAQDMINVEFRDYQFTPYRDAIQLIFTGFKLDQPKIYELDKDIYVSKVEKYINPPKVSFCIEVERYELEKYGLSIVMHHLSDMNIRHQDLERIFAQMKEKMWRYK